MKCRFKICVNEAEKGRTICSKHKSRQNRKNNPVTHIWHYIKRSAKKRNIEFNLPFEQFKQFIVDNNYLNNRGRKIKNFNIDRRDGSKGYTMENIQVITKELNLKKYHYNNDLPF